MSCIHVRIAMVVACFFAATTTTVLSDADSGDLRSTLEAALAIESEPDIRKIRYDHDVRARFLRDVVFTDRVEEIAEEKGILDALEVRSALVSARNKVLLDAVRGHLRRESNPTAEALEALARDLYDAYPEHYGIPRKIRIAHISIQSDSCKVTDAEKTLKDIAERVDSFEDFAMLAQEYSEAPNAREGGKVRQWLIEPKKPETQPLFVTKAFELQNEGDLSEPFESGTGWHLVLLLENSPGSPMPFDEAKKRIVDDLDREYRDRAARRKLAALREFDRKAVDDLLEEVIDQHMRESEARKTEQQ